MNYTRTITIAAAAIAAAAGTAHAQPFVHHIGEPTDSAEVANDLTILRSGNIAFVGNANVDAFNFQSSGYIVINDANGVPLISWIVEDFDTIDNPARAVRQDPADNQLIIMQQGILGLGAPEDYVIYKFDQASGAIQYAWRYPGTTQAENLGMEIAGESSVLAATIRGTANSEQTTLLRFDNATGLPIFHNRYAIVDAPVFNAGFFDVLEVRDTGDIYAVGYADIDDPFGNINGRTVLVARFDATGNPIFFRAYDALLPGDDSRLAEGVGIELTENNEIAVVARRTQQFLPPHALHMTLDPVFGNVLAASLIFDQQNLPITPATSSLERAPDNTLLVAGTTLGVQGLSIPAMWNVDASSTNLNWWWSPQPDLASGIGFTAIPQPQAGALLGGLVFPIPVNTFGGIDDALLARTDFSGNGFCPYAPEIQQPLPFVNTFDIPVEPIPLPSPNDAGLQAVQGEPQVARICSPNLPCPEDLNGDGFIDLADLLIVLANFGVGPGGDVNGDLVTDLADLLQLLAVFGTPCP